MWRLVYDVLRFNACARRIAMRWSREDEKLSIGRYLEREGYSDAFRDNYLIVRGCYVAFGQKSHLCAFVLNSLLLLLFGVRLQTSVP